MRADREREIGTTGFPAGWSEGVEMGAYLADPAVSASLLWTLHQHTPSHALEEVRNRKPHTAATELGDLVHAAVWEPADFDERYVVVGQCEATKKGDGERCTNAGSVIREGRSYCKTKGHDPMPGEPMDVATVQAETKQHALSMKAALLAHSTARELIAAPGPREVVGVALDQRTDLWLRIRPDHLIESPDGTRPLVHWSDVNLKSTGLGAGPGRFVKTNENLGIYFKAAFYRLVLRELWPVEPQNFFYPVVESDGGHHVIVYRMNDDALDIGEAEVRAALDTLADCVESGRWPGYGPAIHDLRLPEWRHRQAHSIDFLEVG